MTPPFEEADLLKLAPTTDDRRVRIRERQDRTWLSLRNEFAMVEVSVHTDANGARLILRDTESGDQIALDPLELEALTRLSHSDFGPIILR